MSRPSGGACRSSSSLRIGSGSASTHSLLLCLPVLRRSGKWQGPHHQSFSRYLPMNARTVLFACVAMVMAFFGASALGQGFAGLGTDAKGFNSPMIGTPLQFPRDFGAHPDFRIEWWYLTAN